MIFSFWLWPPRRIDMSITKEAKAHNNVTQGLILNYSILDKGIIGLFLCAPAHPQAKFLEDSIL